MTTEDFYNGTYSKIRAFAFTPLGLGITINEVSHFLDDQNGNENGLGVAVGAYLLLRGVTGAINLYRQRDGLERKIED